MKRAMVALVVLAALFVPHAASATSGRTVVREYIGLPPSNPLNPIVCRDGLSGNVPGFPDGADIDGSCLGIEEGETTLDIAVADDNVDEVVASYSFHSSWNTTVDWGYFCGSITDLAIPDDAVFVTVGLHDESLLANTCPDAEEATTGTITAHFE